MQVERTVRYGAVITLLALQHDLFYAELKLSDILKVHFIRSAALQETEVPNLDIC